MPQRAIGVATASRLASDAQRSAPARNQQRPERDGARKDQQPESPWGTSRTRINTLDAAPHERRANDDSDGRVERDAEQYQRSHLHSLRNVGDRRAIRARASRGVRRRLGFGESQRLRHPKMCLGCKVLRTVTPARHSGRQDACGIRFTVGTRTECLPGRDLATPLPSWTVPVVTTSEWIAAVMNVGHETQFPPA